MVQPLVRGVDRQRVVFFQIGVLRLSQFPLYHSGCLVRGHGLPGFLQGFRHAEEQVQLLFLPRLERELVLQNASQNEQAGLGIGAVPALHHHGGPLEQSCRRGIRQGEGAVCAAKGLQVPVIGERRLAGGQIPFVPFVGGKGVGRITEHPAQGLVIRGAHAAVHLVIARIGEALQIEGHGREHAEAFRLVSLILE